MSFVKAFNNLTIARSYVSIRSLHPKKFVSILDKVPPRPRNPWQIYVRENMNNYKNSSGKTDLKLATKELSAKWKALSEAEKKPFEATYKKESEEHLAKMDEALKKATPQQFAKENALRKKYNLAILKDPKQPKRPLNAFFFYIEHLRNNKDSAFVAASPREQVSLAAKRFKKLSASEVEVYNEKAKGASDQYQKDISAYEQHAKEIQRINQAEISSGKWSDTGSWHAQYKDTAWIFAGSLPFELTEGDIVCIFSQYGEIIHIELIRDHKTGKSKGFAFLQYEDQRSTILAVDNLNGANVLGRTVRVDHSYGPKKQKKKNEEESDSDDDQPKMNVAPEFIEIVEKKEKSKPKPVDMDEEDPMAAYFRDKKEKKSKKKDKSSSSRHHKHKSSKEEGSRLSRHRYDDDDRSPPRRSSHRSRDRSRSPPRRSYYRSGSPRRSRSPARRSRSPRR